MIVVPLFSKQPQDLLDGLEEGLKDMGGKPESIYTDDEGSLNSKLLQDYFKQNNIKHITTRTHAPVAAVVLLARWAAPAAAAGRHLALPNPEDLERTRLAGLVGSALQLRAGSAWVALA